MTRGSSLRFIVHNFDSLLHFSKFKVKFMILNKRFDDEHINDTRNGRVIERTRFASYCRFQYTYPAQEHRK